MKLLNSSTHKKPVIKMLCRFTRPYAHKSFSFIRFLLPQFQNPRATALKTAIFPRQQVAAMPCTFKSPDDKPTIERSRRSNCRGIKVKDELGNQFLLLHPASCLTKLLTHFNGEIGVEKKSRNVFNYRRVDTCVMFN